MTYGRVGVLGYDLDRIHGCGVKRLCSGYFAASMAFIAALALSSLAMVFFTRLSVYFLASLLTLTLNALAFFCQCKSVF